MNSGPLMSTDLWDTTPKWVNPCGLTATTVEDTEGDSDVAQLQDEQLLEQIVVQAKTALVHAQLFVDEFVSNTENYQRCSRDRSSIVVRPRKFC